MHPIYSLFKIRLIICLIVGYQSISLVAQTRYPATMTTFLNPPYSLYLSDFADPATTMVSGTLIFNDLSESSWDVKLRFTLESTRLKLQTSPDFFASQPITLIPGIPYTLQATDLAPYLDIRNLQAMGITPAELSQNGRLPEGLYTFTIEALDFRTGKVLSNKSSAVAWLVLKDPPRIISPICNSYLKPQQVQNIFFQWQNSNAFSPNSAGTEYQLKIDEITDTTNGDARSAIQNAKTLPIFQSAFSENFNLQYDVSQPALDLGKAYAFRVQAVEQNGKDTYKNQGYSEVCWFYYGFPNNRKINPVAPSLGYFYTKIDKPVFRWTAPDKTIQGQSFTYNIKVVKKDSSQTAEEALRDNPVWHQEESFSYITKNVALRVDKPLEPNTEYAWQVTCKSEEQEVAKSPAWWFKGPPVCSVIEAGIHKIRVRSTSNTDLKHLNGKGYLLINNDTVNVEFNNLQVGDLGGIYVLDGGAVYKEFDKTYTIDIQPKQPKNPVSQFQYTALRLDRESLTLKGFLKYPLPHPVASEQKTYIETNPTWINFDRLKVSSTLKCKKDNSFRLLEPFDFKLGIDTTSVFYVFDNKYDVFFQGSVTLNDKTKSESGIPITYNFNYATNITYLPAGKCNTQGSVINVVENTGYKVRTDSVVIDLDEEQSPGGLNAGWKGAWFSDYSFIWRSEIDNSGQLSIASELSYPQKQTSGTETVCRVGSQGLTFAITQVLNDSAGFNTFSAKIARLGLKVNNGSVVNSTLTGKLLLPIISSSTYYNYILPIANDGFMDGYMEKLDGAEFYLNQGKGEREVKVKVNRAVFTNKDRLAMNVDVGWPGLGIQLNGLGGFFAWGSYDIGFGEKNGAVALMEQTQGKVGGYPFNADGIGAGSSGGMYSIVITGKINMGEDVSGANGAPTTNIYSIVPNAYARKDGEASKDYTAGGAKKPSGGENTPTQVVDETKPGLTPEEAAQSKDAIVSAADRVKESLTSSGSKAYGAAEFTGVSSPSLEQGIGALLEYAKNRYPEKYEVLMDMIALATDPAHALLDDKLEKVSDKVNVKIDTLLSRSDEAIEDKVGLLINIVRDKVITLVKGKDPILTSSINSLAESAKNATAEEIKRSIRSSVTKNIKEPLTALIKDSVTARLSLIIKEEIGSIGFDLEAGAANAEFKGNMGKALDRIIAEMLADLNVQKITSTITKTGEDAILGISMENIYAQMSKDLVSIAAKAAVEAGLNKAINSATEKMGVKVPVNMADLADKLAKGDIKGALLAFDPIEIKINSNFMSLSGWIKFSPDDPTYGNIWRGDINLDMKIPKPFAFTAVYMNGRKDDYSYWFCQLTPGIKKDSSGKASPMGGALSKSVNKMDNPVALGPVQIMGVTGRVWYKMVDSETGIVPDGTKTYGAYMRLVLFDKAESGKNIRMDIAAGIQLDESGDYEIEFNGNAQFKSGTANLDVPDPSAQVAVSIYLYLNSKEEHFIGKAKAEIKQGVCISATLFVETKPGYWIVKVGDQPFADRIKITPGCAGWGGQGWFIINQKTAEIGLGLSISIDQNVGFNAAGFEIKVYVSAGVAAAIMAEFQYNPSLALNKAGIFIDIYGNVRVCYASPSVDLGFTRIAAISGCITLVELSIHGELVVTFNPKPTKVSGKVDGHITVLEMFSCGFSAGFDMVL